MVLEYYRQPETGENWLVVRRNGATGAELWRPIAEYHKGAEVLHLSPIDRARLDSLRATGLRAKVSAWRSEWYTLQRFGRYGVSVTSNVHTTTREPNATLVLPHAECYEYAGTYYER